MPAPVYERTLKAWTKTCANPKCLWKFTGVDDYDESFKIFSTHFFAHNKTTDGLQPRCKSCHCGRIGYRDNVTRNGKVYGVRAPTLMTHKDRLDLYKKQGGNCAVCRKPIEFSKCAVEHNHHNGKIRGLVHNMPMCNQVLEIFDDKERFDNVIDFLLENDHEHWLVRFLNGKDSSHP